MKVCTGPISQTVTDWGLEEGSTTAVVGDHPEGHPEVLAAQMLCGAAAAGVHTLVLTPKGLEDEPVWDPLTRILAGPRPDGRKVAESLAALPLVICRWGAGWERLGDAHLVYAAGLAGREVRRLRGATSAPVLTSAEIGAGEVIRVGETSITLQAAGVRVPVRYDPDGPMYVPA